MSIRWNKHLIILYDKQKNKLICDALKEYVKGKFSSCDVLAIDDAGYINKINRFFRVASHKFNARKCRSIVKWKSIMMDKKDIHRIKEERATITSGEERKLPFPDKRSLAIRRMVNILNRFRPEMVMCTSVYSLRLALLAKKILAADTRVVAVISDFVLSHGYVRAGIDCYLVENEVIKNALMRFGVDRDKIIVFGVPFIESQKPIATRHEARKLMGIKGELPLVVVNGSDYCTATIKDKVAKLMNERGRYCMVVLTYGNSAVKRYYRRLPKFSNVEIIFKDRLEYELIFAGADVIFTVPDTHFIYSAFVNRIPVVLASGVTVLENDIFKYLVRNALVTPVKTPEETYAAVEELIIDTERREEMIERGLAYYDGGRTIEDGYLAEIVIPKPINSQAISENAPEAAGAEGNSAEN